MHLVPKEKGQISLSNIGGVPIGIWVPIDPNQSWNIAKIEVSGATIDLFIEPEIEDAPHPLLNIILSLSYTRNYFDVYDSHGHIIESQRDIIELLYDECEDEEVREDLLDMF